MPVTCVFPSYLSPYTDALRERLRITEAITDGALAWFNGRATALSQNALVAAFHDWRESSGYPADPSSSAAFLSFSNLGNLSSLVDDNYPRLPELLDTVAEHCAIAASELNDRWQSDTAKLSELGIAAGSKLLHVEFHDEETHNNGRTVAILTTSSGKIVYKPRSGAGEAALNATCELLGADPWTLVAPTLDRGDYCWQTFINSPDEVDFDTFITSASILVAAAALLGTTDLHAGGRPPESRHIGWSIRWDYVNSRGLGFKLIW